MKNKFFYFAVLIVTIAIVSACIGNAPAVSESSKNVNSKTVSFHINHNTAEIAGKTLIFFDSPDNYLTEINSPKVPVYIKKFVLSENSILKNISLKKAESKDYDNVFVDITIDEHYPVWETKGFYPENIFWYNIFELLDKRKEIEVAVVGAQYNSETKQAKVYNSIEILIEYEGSIYEEDG